MGRATTSANRASTAPPEAPKPAERRKRATDRRKDADRRAFPPRPEGRRAVGGRRKGDPVDA